METDDDLLTSTEVAALLRVHPKHLYRLLRRGLPGHRVGRGHWRFRRAEVLAWLDARDDAPRDSSLEVATVDRDAERWWVSRIRDRWVAHAVGSESTRAADALGSATANGRARLSLSDDPEALAANLLIAGCAPPLGPLLDGVQRGRARGHAHWIRANSQRALALLAEGQVHCAGVHLEGAGRSNDQAARAVMHGVELHLVHLVRWRLGLAVPPSDPKGLAELAQLGRPDVSIAAREPGSGARSVLERALAEAEVSTEVLAGARIFGSHADVAQAVALSVCDVGITLESAARERGLAFFPLVEEAFELIVPTDLLDTADLRATLGALDSPRMRREVAALGPYDGAALGHVRAVAP